MAEVQGNPKEAEYVTLRAWQEKTPRNRPIKCNECCSMSNEGGCQLVRGVGSIPCTPVSIHRGIW